MNGPESSTTVALLDANDLFAEVLATALRLRGLGVLLPAGGRWPDLTADMVVLLDAALVTSGTDGSVRRHVTAVPDARVLLVADAHARGQSTLARDLSAVGWVSRDGTVDDVVHAIAQARMPGHGRPLAPRRSHEDSSTHGLTSRELQILDRVAAGATDEEVAGELAISVHTVRAHLQNVRFKLGVTNRFAAVAAARSAHLLSDHVDARPPHGSPQG